MQKSIKIFKDTEGIIPKELYPPYISDEVEKILEFVFKILTQLRVISGMDSKVLGFDYNALFSVAKIYKFKLNEKRMDLIRVAEKEIIKAYNKE